MSDDNRESSSGELEDKLKVERKGIVAEFIDFMRENKVYWMAPLLVMALALAGLFIAASASGALSPFIYALF